jgi:hypothetical protein
MRSFIITLGLILLIAATASSPLQGTCIPHPADATATLQGSFTIDLALSSNCNVRCDVCTWRTSGGSGTELTIDPASIRFTGDSQTPDTIDVVTLFNFLSQTAVVQAYSLGYITCPPVCSDTYTSKVYQASCVQRNGSGSSTLFSACGSGDFCAQVYKICCPNGMGSPAISYLRSEGTICTGGVSGTCLATCQ